MLISVSRRGEQGGADSSTHARSEKPDEIAQWRNATETCAAGDRCQESRALFFRVGVFLDNAGVCVVFAFGSGCGLGLSGGVGGLTSRFATYDF